MSQESGKTPSSSGDTIEFKEIRAIDLKKKAPHYVQRASTGERFIITRKGKEMAILGPYGVEESAEAVASRDVPRHLGALLNGVIAGKRYVISKSRKEIATLLPVPVRETEKLTSEQMQKLMLLDSISLETLRRAIALALGEKEAERILQKLNKDT